MKYLLLPATLLLLACSSNAVPVVPAPVSPLVGTWRYVSNNFEDLVARNIESYLTSRGGLLSSMASETARKVTDGMRQVFPPLFIFNADGTYAAEGGVGGKWTTLGETFTLTEGRASGEYLFAVTGNTVTVFANPADFQIHMEIYVGEFVPGFSEGLSSLEFRFIRQ